MTRSVEMSAKEELGNAAKDGNNAKIRKLSVNKVR